MWQQVEDLFDSCREYYGLCVIVGGRSVVIICYDIITVRRHANVLAGV